MFMSLLYSPIETLAIGCSECLVRSASKKMAGGIVMFTVEWWGVGHMMRRKNKKHLKQDASVFSTILFAPVHQNKCENTATYRSSFGI